MTEENQKERINGGQASTEEQEQASQENTQTVEETFGGNIKDADEKADLYEAMALAEEENFGDAVKKIDEMEKKAQPPLTSEAFGDSEPITPKPEENLAEEYEGRDGIEVEYDLKGEEISPALLLFQKRVIFKRNMIYTAILAVIFVLYLISVVMTPSYGLGYFMMLVCATVAGFLWYLPYRHRKSTAAASDSVDDRFKLKFYDDSVLVGEGSAMYRIKYVDDQVKAVARKDMLIVMVGRERLFVVPLRCTGEQTMEQLRLLLKNALNDNFMDESEFLATEKMVKPAEKKPLEAEKDPAPESEQ